LKIFRIAVAGAGHMGSLHAEKVAALERDGEGVHLVGIADVDLPRARELASRLGVRAAPNIADFLNEVDAVIVAVPTVHHYGVVRDVLEARRDVLVEKPLAATLEQGEELLRLAERGGCLVQVGHLEWFNTAMQVMRERIDRPRFVEAHRMGPFPDRATDIDVVRDLMIHDLDILGQLLDEAPVQVEGVGVPVLSDNLDIANARLTYPGGCVANLTASRVSASPMRKIRFFQRDGYFSIDFLEQSAVVIRRKLDDDGTPTIDIEPLAVDRGDALLAQLRAFVRALDTREKPAVDAASGLDALRTAIRVLDSMPPLDEL